MVVGRNIYPEEDCMSLLTDEGGPAFPTETAECFKNGMTLRQAYALAALPAVIKVSTATALAGASGGRITDAQIEELHNPKAWAAAAFAVADAMVAEGNK